MDRTRLPVSQTASPASPPYGCEPGQLRLYVARSTPNSVRAEHNLSTVLAELEHQRISPILEIIDVFSQPKRAITDGVVVTPTLIGLVTGRRIMLMGDLADQSHLKRTLEGFLGSATPTGG
ncbi:MAG: hypothetical protein JWR77_2158 [Rhizorhabdus sp.]|nr:hypothetical protein [Rhizorhabdus sp.]